MKKFILGVVVPNKDVIVFLELFHSSQKVRLEFGLNLQQMVLDLLRLSDQLLPAVGQGVHSLSIAIIKENIVLVQHGVALFHGSDRHVDADLCLPDLGQCRHMGADIVQVLDGSRQSLGEIFDEVQDLVHLMGTLFIQGLGVGHLPVLGLGNQGQFEWFRAQQGGSYSVAGLHLFLLRLEFL